MTRIGFLGPPGTFGEEALRTQPDLVQAELVPIRTMLDVLAGTQKGEVDLGFVALENSIDGTVNESLDSLIFERDVLIQREVILRISLHLLVPPGTAMADVREIHSYPKALAQCRMFLADRMPDVEVHAATSTAEAVRYVGEERPPHAAAVGTALAAKLYGLEILESEIEDHPDNSTRFVLVAPNGSPGCVPAPTGHDKTSIVCFQRADRPGSLLSILSEFASRNINLTKLESRPTRRGLGDYCFIIDLEGHVADEVVADCLRNLHAQLAELKFLGSYPAASEHAPALRREAEASWQAADAWITSIRDQIRR
ncbi:MAG: Prephenate dehydratase [uncultured Acidimicrobiales bacterium]|uniref:Prephenate dehydratase n=1 Tax=uncultured Acidimicrobiales bacterium TaxID=310071 RepID=A0A6J4HGB2_9ACTN|nr:MAG: Prephenate dehydratase [uncultured Acidimicrobiales bacterium]